MSLDFNRIKNSIEHSRKKLSEKKPTLSPDLYLLEDFLYPELITGIVDYVTKSSNVPWEKVKLQENKPRMQITWCPGTIVEETHNVMENLTDSINGLFATNYKFNGIVIWKDTESYTISKHSDNKIIAAAIQIYLNSGPANLNTSFYSGKDIIPTNYKENFGYLMHNVNCLKHGMTSAVPKDFVRYSMYAIWSQNDRI